MFLQNPYVEALTPKLAVFGDGASKEVIRLVLRVDPVGETCPYKKKHTKYICSLSLPIYAPRKDHVRT